MKLIIGENNILYGQDLRADRGIPKGKYDVRKVDNRVVLTAPGFGEENNYGNGALSVTISQLPKKVQIRINNEL